MAYRFKLTARAQADLDEILGYLTVQLKNPQAAAHFLSEFQASVREVCAYPESGAPVDNEFLPTRAIRKTTVNRYVAYYLPDRAAQAVYVLRVVFGRRNLEEILREMPVSLGNMPREELDFALEKGYAEEEDGKTAPMDEAFEQIRNEIK